MLFFSPKENLKEKNPNHGLAVTVEELLEEQKNIPYLSAHFNGVTSEQAGDVKSAFKGRGMEFSEVRAYNFGDDVRDIDWRVTARKSAPYTKVFNEEKDREIIVVLDMSASMIFGTRKELKSVTAAKTAALIGWQAIHNKDRFGLLLYDGQKSTYFKPQNNLANLMAVFNRIAQASSDVLQQQHLGDISQISNILEYSHKGQANIFILSDFKGIDSEKFKKIAALARRHKVYCVNIFDIVEEIAPTEGVYAAQYESEKIVFDSTGSAFREAYLQYFAERHRELKYNCKKFSCFYAEIRTDVPIFKQLRLR